MCADTSFELTNWLAIDAERIPLTASDTVVFYPSCGTSLLWTLANLPGDIIVMSDYLPARYPDLLTREAFLEKIRADFDQNAIPVEIEHIQRTLVRLRSRDKLFLLFFEDNNDTLSRIVASGARISTFVSICDGCAEGGNYECVNEASFLSRILTVATPDFRLYTDHSRMLENRSLGYYRGEYPRHAYFHDRVAIEGAIPGSFVRHALLVAPRLQSLDHPWGAAVCDDDLTLYPTGAVSAGLKALQPFRTKAGRGILVEYGFEPFNSTNTSIEARFSAESDALKQRQSYPLSVVLNIPHAGTDIPPQWRETFVLTDDAMSDEIACMTDHHTGVLFDASAAPGRAVIASVSRLLVDTERFLDDTAEPMSACGMGALYTLTSRQQRLRGRPGRVERATLLNRYHVAHHSRLAQLVTSQLEQYGHALVLDCHSFPDVALPYEACSDGPRPDICIGTDDFHTPPALRDAMVEAFTQAGFTVAVNAPYAGALVPFPFYGTDKRVSGIMVEVNRRLYLGRYHQDGYPGPRASGDSLSPALDMEMPMLISGFCKQVLSRFCDTLSALQMLPVRSTR